MRPRAWLIGICLVASLATASGPYASESRGTGRGRSSVSAERERGHLLVAPTRELGASRRPLSGRQAVILPPRLARGDVHPGATRAPGVPVGRRFVDSPLFLTLQARAPPPPSPSV